MLAVVGLIGWTTHRTATPVSASAPALGYGNPEPAVNPAPYGNPAPYANTAAYPPANAYGESPGSYPSGYYSGASSGAVYAESPFSSDGAYGYVAPPPPAVAVAEPPAERVVVEREYVYRHGRRYVVYHRRNHHLRHELEVIGGTAAVGAGIGAIAGGGKGAAIGALAGGAGGYVYEKLHK